LYEVTESLAGLPVNVEFISYDDIVNKGIPDDVHVILNAGRLDTAWCGGKHWENEKVIEILSSWVADGGGFIGIGEPSACLHSSQYFQLSEVLGVDRQTSQNFGNPRRQYTLAGAKHFILEDAAGTIDFGDDIDDIYIIGKDTQVLVDNHNSPQITTHPFGRGRAIYLSGFKFTAENSRLLHRALFWAAGKESLFRPLDMQQYPDRLRVV
jgi:beta-D-galactosyl-(1->4)-L-rhamnose phosphorylase